MLRHYLQQLVYQPWVEIEHNGRRQGWARDDATVPTNRQEAGRC